MCHDYGTADLKYNKLVNLPESQATQTPAGEDPAPMEVEEDAMPEEFTDAQPPPETQPLAPRQPAPAPAPAPAPTPRKGRKRTTPYTEEEQAANLNAENVRAKKRYDEANLKFRADRYIYKLNSRKIKGPNADRVVEYQITINARGMYVTGILSKKKRVSE